MIEMLQSFVTGSDLAKVGNIPPLAAWLVINQH